MTWPLGLSVPLPLGLMNGLVYLCVPTSVPIPGDWLLAPQLGGAPGDCWPHRWHSGQRCRRPPTLGPAGLGLPGRDTLSP